MPTLRELERLPGQGVLVEVVGGERDGALVVLVGGERAVARRALADVVPGVAIEPRLFELVGEECNRCGPAPARRPWPRRLRRVEPAVTARSRPSREAARALLESLLDSSQLAIWRRSGRFTVQVPGGSVELGELYNLHYRGCDGADRSLCVVPVEHDTLPIEDIWTTLLLVLWTEPERFFAVANHRPWGSTGGYERGPVPRSGEAVRATPRSPAGRAGRDLEWSGPASIR